MKNSSTLRWRALSVRLRKPVSKLRRARLRSAHRCLTSSRLRARHSATTRKLKWKFLALNLSRLVFRCSASA